MEFVDQNWIFNIDNHPSIHTRARAQLSQLLDMLLFEHLACHLILMLLFWPILLYYPFPSVEANFELYLIQKNFDTHFLYSSIYFIILTK